MREQFVVEEIMNDSILIALETYGLVGAQGEGTEAELNTDMNEMIAVSAKIYEATGQLLPRNVRSEASVGSHDTFIYSQRCLPADETLL